MPEEADFDRLADLDALPFLHEDLPGVLASVLSVETGHTILFGVMSFLEGLKSCHEVVPSSHAGCNDTLGDTSSNGTFDDGSDGVHRANDLGLKLRRDVELDLLEEILGRTETTHDENILIVGLGTKGTEGTK